MGMPEFMLVCLLTMPCTVAHAQENKKDEWSKTKTTAFPMSIYHGWWPFIGKNNDVVANYLQLKSGDLTSRFIITWVTQYRYKENIVKKINIAINTDKHEYAYLALIDFNMTTGKLLNCQLIDPNYIPILKGSLADDILSVSKDIVAYAKE